MVLINEIGETIYEKRLSNELANTIYKLKQFAGIESLVVESTYNWYWLVDSLMEQGYQLKLANPNAIQSYDEINQTNDKTDARWLA